MSLSIPLLETFILVASLGSFGAAARRLGLTQPAISYQIKSLEQELGAPLIDRTRGKVVLTPAGRTAFRHATRIVANCETMLADIPRTTGEVAGRLLIGCSSISGNYLLPPLVTEFKKLHPDVSISLEINDSAEVVTKVKNEQVELAFTGNMSRDPKLFVRRFSDDALVLVVPPDHRLAKQATVELSDLVNEQFVYRKVGSGTRRKLEQALVDQGISPEQINVVAEMSTNQAVLSAVQAGMGVAVVSEFAAESPARDGLVSVCSFTEPAITRKIFVMYRKSDSLSLAAESFLEFCLG